MKREKAHPSSVFSENNQSNRSAEHSGKGSAAKAEKNRQRELIVVHGRKKKVALAHKLNGVEFDK